MLARQIALTIAAFSVCALLSAILVWTKLPAPPGSPDQLAFIAKLLLLCLLGPLTFVWAWGPQPLNLIALVSALFVPLLSITVLYFGYFRARSLILLATSAVIWCGFGGYSAYLAVSGSI